MNPNLPENLKGKNKNGTVIFCLLIEYEEIMSSQLFDLSNNEKEPEPARDKHSNMQGKDREM